MATLKDISKATGFSITTISRALNGYKDVSEETKKKVNEAAAHLGYSPNILARSLVMKQSRTIGFVVTDIKRESTKDNFMFETLCGVSDFLATSGYEFLLLSADTSKQRNKTYKQICTERLLDGAIIQGLKIEDPYLQEAVKSDIPCVLIDIPAEGKDIGYVTSDQLESAKNAVKYLNRMGHTNIAYVNGSENAHVSKIRKNGYLEAMTEAQLTVKEEFIVNGDFSEERAKQMTIPLLLNHPEISAIFCASDVMALGVLQAARQLQIKVPDHLSIVGFDNILLSKYVTPPLTTVSQSPYDMGHTAARMLINLIEGKPTEKIVKIQNELIVRDSVAAKD